MTIKIRDLNNVCPVFCYNEYQGYVYKDYNTDCLMLSEHLYKKMHDYCNPDILLKKHNQHRNVKTLIKSIVRLIKKKEQK